MFCSFAGMTSLAEFKTCRLPTNCLSVFDHFLKLALKGLIMIQKSLSGISLMLLFIDVVYLLIK